MSCLGVRGEVGDITAPVSPCPAGGWVPGQGSAQPLPQQWRGQASLGHHLPPSLSSLLSQGRHGLPGPPGPVGPRGPPGESIEQPGKKGDRVSNPLPAQPGVLRHRDLAPGGLFLPLHPLPKIRLVRRELGGAPLLHHTPARCAEGRWHWGQRCWGHLWHCCDTSLPCRDSLELMGGQEALAAPGTPGPPGSR